jgi:hypothetical protein
MVRNMAPLLWRPAPGVRGGDEKLWPGRLRFVVGNSGFQGLGEQREPLPGRPKDFPGSHWQALRMTRGLPRLSRDAAGYRKSQHGQSLREEG